MIGQILQAVGDVWGTVYQNRGNREEARLNRAFQEDMSNTAYQRAMQDMESAGLNPMLSLTHQAATPGGAQARIEAPSIGAAMSTAAQTYATLSQTEKTEAETEAVKEAIPGVVAESQSKVASAAVAERMAAALLGEKEAAAKEGTERAKYAANRASEEYMRMMADRQKAQHEKDIVGRENTLQAETASQMKEARKAELRRIVVDELLAQLEVPGAKAEADAWKNPVLGGQVRAYARDVQGISSAYRNFFPAPRR